MNINELKEIDLGIDPISNLKLKGMLLDFYWDPFIAKIIRLRVDVSYFSLEDNPIESNRFQKFTKEHYSDNSLMVNEYGLVDENGMIGEYDFFIAYTENNLIDLVALIKSKILEAKARGVYYI